MTTLSDTHYFEYRGVQFKLIQNNPVRNLYLAGGSLFMTGGDSNPTLTVVALGHRSRGAGSTGYFGDRADAVRAIGEAYLRQLGGRAVQLEGWILSRTEAEICALTLLAD